jgi:hypothetical protein
MSVANNRTCSSHLASMKKHSMFLCMTAMLLLPACALWTRQENDGYRIRYFDRNGDGRVDLEVHTFPGAADADWQLCDDNYDGRFEKRVVFGVGVSEQKVDLPVPANVRISHGTF